MIEQLDVPAEATVASVSLRRALSADVRASLESVRAAQETARRQARRETLRARVWLATAVGAVGLAAFAFGPGMLRGRHARPQAPTAAPPSVQPSAIASPAPAAVAMGAPAPAMGTPVSTDPTPVADQGKPSDVVAPADGCDTDLIRKAPWRLSSQACARAFDAHPGDASLALAIAHAEHAHGSVAEAAHWAQRALALDPNAAEAYILIARADAANGRREEARTAYRHYLALAPRGWHQTEARAALRAAHP